MRKRLFSLALALVLCLGLTIPALAGDTGTIGQMNLISTAQHSALVDANGTLWMWGKNDNGQLGNGTREDSNVPLRIMEDVSCVATSQDSTAVIKKDGTLWMWGRCGGLLADYDFERLWGNPSKVPDYLIPIMESSESLGMVYTKPFMYPTSRISNAKSVAFAAFIIAVVKNDGTLWMWGSNSGGVIDPISTAPTVEAPIKVMDRVAAVSAGNDHVAAIRDDRSLWTWGDCTYGALGIGIPEGERYRAPAKVLDHVAAVSCGSNHTAALKEDGTLWVWGLNNSGQLGIDGKGNHSVTVNADIGGGSHTNYMQTVPTQVLAEVSSVACGNTHTAAIKNDGTLLTWGNNRAGQLGNGTKRDSSTPQKIMGDVTAVCCGPLDTVITKADGSVWSCGNNRQQTVPAQIPGLNSQVPGDNGQLPAPSDGGFTDVPSNAYFAAPVSWAVSKGITTGTSGTKFSPGEKCTHIQILTFLYRAVEQIKAPSAADMEKAVAFLFVMNQSTAVKKTKRVRRP